MELIILIIIGYVVFRIMKSKKKANEAIQYALNPGSPAVKVLINEAVDVINDMLEVGLSASLFSDEDYEGHIIAVADARPPFSGDVINYGFHISMVHISDLRSSRNNYPARQGVPHWQPHYAELDRFIQKYGHYYDCEQKRYIFKTKNTVYIHRNEQTKLQALLHEQVRTRCPLADLSGAGIHTANVAH